MTASKYEPSIFIKKKKSKLSIDFLEIVLDINPMNIEPNMPTKDIKRIGAVILCLHYMGFFRVILQASKKNVSELHKHNLLLGIQ